IRACRYYFPPAIRITQNKIDILTRSHVDAHIAPGGTIEEGPIAAIKILATQIEDPQWLPFPGAQIFLHELSHLIERTRMHRPTQSLDAPRCNPLQGTLEVGQITGFGKLERSGQEILGSHRTRRHPNR